MKRLIHQLYYAEDSYSLEIITAPLDEELYKALTFIDVALDPRRVFNKAAALFAGICRGGDLTLLLPADFGAMSLSRRGNIHYMVTYVLLKVYDLKNPNVRNALAIYENSLRDNMLKYYFDGTSQKIISQYGRWNNMPHFISTPPSQLSVDPDEWQVITDNFREERIDYIKSLYPDCQQQELVELIAKVSVGRDKAYDRKWSSLIPRIVHHYFPGLKRKRTKHPNYSIGNICLLRKLAEQEKAIAQLKRLLQEGVIPVCAIKERLLEMDSETALTYNADLNTLLVNFTQWTSVSHDIEMEIRRKAEKEKHSNIIIRENRGIISGNISGNITTPQFLNNLSHEHQS